MRAIIISAVSSLLIGSGAGKFLEFQPAAFLTPAEAEPLPSGTDDPGMAAYKTLVGSQGVSIAPSTYFTPMPISYPYAQDDGADLAYLEASTLETRRQLAALEAQMDQDRSARFQTANFEIPLALRPAPVADALPVPDPAPADQAAVEEPVPEAPTADVQDPQ